MNNKYTINTVSLFALMTLAAPSFAGDFATITLDNSYSDWAGISPAATDVTTDGNPVDFTELYVANDDDYLYLRFTLDTAAALNGTNNQVYISIDNDNNTATGYDVYSLGLIGSEVAWQNDFPFAQDTGNFNSGTLTGGAATIAGYNSVVTGQEIGISRAATFDSNGSSIFPNDTISILVYSNGTTADDVIGTATYTFAVPEPTSTALILSVLSLGITTLRRHKH